MAIEGGLAQPSGLEHEVGSSAAVSIHSIGLDETLTIILNKFFATNSLPHEA